MIWHVALSDSPRRWGNLAPPHASAFHPRFIATLHKLCAWPAAESRDERVLLEFWTSVMGYNASRADEYVAWRDFFLREYADAARPRRRLLP